MSSSLALLDSLPPAAEFYARYWNKRPFLVRDAIDGDVLDGLIAPDELAALSMEETVRARIVSCDDWTCQFGPFSEKDFDAAREAPWSLLVQNVEQFHPDTARLLGAFDFAPRWLMDDIMVSFSTAGGTIGGHVDSYHVFLVQGGGTRRWTIGDTPIFDEKYIEGLDLKILDQPVHGDSVDVTAGDILYVPPHFAHEGTTLDDALTYSVGFLGPKLSELFGAYGQHLADNEALDVRYEGGGLRGDSAGFGISGQAVDMLRDRFSDALNAPAFSEWLAAFFTGSSREDTEDYGEREDALTRTEFANAVRDGTGLIKPAYVKFALVPMPGGAYALGFNRETFVIADDAIAIILRLMREDPVSVADEPALPDQLGLLHALYNADALEFTEMPG